MAISSEQVFNQPFLYINNMVASWVSNTTLSVTAGICRDSTNTFDINVGNYLGVNPNISANTATTINAAVTGLNGIDTGTFAASKVYAIHAIYDISENPINPPGYLLSLSQTAPTMPFGYGAFRLVGYATTDASTHFLLGYVSGKGTNRKFTYDAPIATAVTAGASTSYAAVTLTTFVPTVEGILASINTSLTPSAAGRGVFLQGGNSTGDQIINLGQVTSVVLDNNQDVIVQLVSGVPKINYKVSNSSDAVAINVAGYSYSL